MVQRLNLREQVMNELGLAIARKELAPGDTLPKESDLSDEYGVSRTVVREAIKGLTARGMVESRARVGTTVCPRNNWKLLDPDVLSWTFQSNRRSKVLWELTEMRLVVEPVAAQWAAERADDEEIEYIRDCFEQLEQAVGDRKAWIDADVKYHDSILMACHNDLIMNLVSTLRSVLHESREATVMMMEEVGSEDAAGQYEAATRQALALHREPFEAIVDGDGERAREGMRSILTWVMDVIQDRVDGRAAPVENS
jgi:DNA-binding FadR family transcriptional regulator